MPEQEIKGWEEKIKKFTIAFEKIAKVVERVGIPVATFVAGWFTVGYSAEVNDTNLSIVGMCLMIASLLAYLWLFSRTSPKIPPSTIKIPNEYADIINNFLEANKWMQEEMTKQNEWARGKNGVGSFEATPPSEQTKLAKETQDFQTED